MHKPLIACAAFAMCLAAAALAQTQPAPVSPSQQGAAPPPVETMDCQQMAAEMTSAGQTTNSHLDPQFGIEANAMMTEAQQKQREAQQQAAGMTITCMIPGMAMACAAQQQQQAAQGQRDAAANQARMQAQMDRLNASMAGLDQARLQAMSSRFEAMHCQDQMQGAQQGQH
jgi:hypothetical protein